MLCLYLLSDTKYAFLSYHVGDVWIMMRRREVNSTHEDQRNNEFLCKYEYKDLRTEQILSFI